MSNEKVAGMNKLTAYGDRRITLKEVADVTGAAYRTVAAYAQKAGWTENGKLTLLNEEQVTVILEAMKRTKNNQYDLASSLQGIDTTKSRALRIDLLHRQIEAEMQGEIDELKTALAAANDLLEKRTTGLETIQRIAEAGGLVMSDRDDIEDTYRRRR
jgi:hypothetical protein